MFKLWRIAIRDLGRNKRRSALTLIAVMMWLPFPRLRRAQPTPRRARAAQTNANALGRQGS